MNATINSERDHFPVLLNELVSIISPFYGGSFIDCTFGQGGYSKEILKNSNNKVIALDRDIDVIKYANNLKFRYLNRFTFKNLKFSDIKKIDLKNHKLKGVVFDLGYSLKQIQNKQKGISFKSNSKLNMKMGLNNFSAYDVINKMSQEDLSKIFKYLGDEKKGKLISRKIVEKRKIKMLNTQDLVQIIDRVKVYKNKKTHNATKTFQALRIFVNQEISELIYGLIESFKILPKGGVIAVVTFHSLEDKIVKYFFKNYSENQNSSRYLPDPQDNRILFKLIKKKPIIPSKEEIKRNPPSRSAKLRYAIKIDEANETMDFEKFIKKFNFFLELESLGKKL